jgi:hydrogenase large subunit
MSKRVTIDPVTRIEGHLRVDVEVEGGKVSKAWSSGQMWRGVENILIGRDPRDAWAITQRICGVCTTVHAVASVRAVENALNLEIPVNAQYIRNLIILAHACTITLCTSTTCRRSTGSMWSAPPRPIRPRLPRWRKASPRGAATAFRNSRRSRTPEGLRRYRPARHLHQRLLGHPAMKLTPEVNLLAVVHYMQALEVQRYANKIVTILGSKSPHIQNVAVGGVANPLSLDSQSVLTIERLLAVKEWIDKLNDFVKNVYLVDVAAIGAFYADWTTYGRGIVDYISVPDIPLDGKGTKFACPAATSPMATSTFKPITSFSDAYFADGVSEAVKHSWYD